MYFGERGVVSDISKKYILLSLGYIRVSFFKCCFLWLFQHFVCSLSLMQDFGS